MITVNEQIVALWALEDILAKKPLTDDERRALITAVLKAIISKK